MALCFETQFTVGHASDADAPARDPAHIGTAYIGTDRRGQARTLVSRATGTNGDMLRIA
jgi:hypothetical protein